eukprot:CAMPEP_0204265096 /NCGR_PEP_ID=MMETSP0468-20130131/9446_1 /ASSEMBLY_ACC=CAM_ASM_000383 /TAXON_ID=2969 /ORGANISM="Oxyrrhis marina" /LENGTH=495 /DNA_ID=CAMNT_0051240015 /DNA_START=120 /DNA_END=1607 /DNA_ORIENTATION=-
MVSATFLASLASVGESLNGAAFPVTSSRGHVQVSEPAVASLLQTGAHSASAGVSHGDGDSDELLRAALVMLRDTTYFKKMKGGTAHLEEVVRAELEKATGLSAARFNVLDVRGQYVKTWESLLQKKPQRAVSRGPGIAETETIVDFEIEAAASGEATTVEALAKIQEAVEKRTFGQGTDIQAAIKGAFVEKGGVPTDDEVADGTMDFPALPAAMPTCGEFRTAQTNCTNALKKGVCRESDFYKKAKVECLEAASDFPSCTYGIWRYYGNCCNGNFRTDNDFASAGQCAQSVEVIAGLPSCTEYEKRGKEGSFKSSVESACERYEASNATKCTQEVGLIYAKCHKKQGCDVDEKTKRDSSFVDCVLAALRLRPKISAKKDSKDANPMALDGGNPFEAKDGENPFAVKEGSNPFEGGNFTMDGMQNPFEENATGTEDPFRNADGSVKEMGWVAIVCLVVLLALIAGAVWYFCIRSSDKQPETVTRTYAAAPQAQTGV